MTEQEAFDEWCPEPYRRRIWTHQSQEAARAAFAAAWYVQEKLKSTLSPAICEASENKGSGAS